MWSALYSYEYVLYVRGMFCAALFSERQAAAERCGEGMTFLSHGYSDRHNLWSLASQPTPLLYATDS